MCSFVEALYCIQCDMKAVAEGDTIYGEAFLVYNTLALESRQLRWKQV
jgi:hypothetical protein